MIDNIDVYEYYDGYSHFIDDADEEERKELPRVQYMELQKWDRFL